MQMIFYSNVSKTHFHMNGCALSLIWNQHILELSKLWTFYIDFSPCLNLHLLTGQLQSAKTNNKPCKFLFSVQYTTHYEPISISEKITFPTRKIKLLW